jgi:hypothetical protein
MSYPKLPAPVPGEVLLICAFYEEDKPRWDGVLRALGGRRDGDTLTLADGGVRLRLAEDPRWDYLHGGNFPALLPEGSPAPPIAVLVDLAASYSDFVLLVDLRDIPGRGVRVMPKQLGPVLADVLDGSLPFDELVCGMDRLGIYQGDGGPPTTPAPTTVIRSSFRRLPITGGTLLVRTDFADDQGWRSLMDALGDPDEDPADEEFDEDNVKLDALVVDDRRYEHLQPAQVPALVRPNEHTTMVALADATTLADPTHPLLVVDLYDTPGQVTRIPLGEAGVMAVNLEISNMDFADFV